jgi:hypothetical protein
MDLRIHVHGFETDGVRVISPTAPEFDALARPLIGERVADTVLEFKPLLMIVANDSSQPIVSYSHVWTVTHASGHRDILKSHTSFPDAICGDGLISHDPEPLRPGTKRINARSIVIHGASLLDPYYDQFLAQFIDERKGLLHDAVDLGIEIETVIFADGTLIGTDRDGWLSNLFSSRIAAKQTWYRGVLDALAQGQTVEQAFQPVATFLSDSKMRMDANPRGYFRSLHEPGAASKQEAAAHVAHWRRRFKDEEIPTRLRDSIRLEPFTIERRGTPAST